MIEGDPMLNGIDVEYPWETGNGGTGKMGRAHTARLRVPPFHIDITPVTKGAYATWLQESGWRPNSTQNWLKDWIAPTVRDGLPRVRSGQTKQPVVWVSRADAQAYCRAHGARLPHSVEWQLAAQGE